MSVASMRPEEAEWPAKDCALTEEPHGGEEEGALSALLEREAGDDDDPERRVAALGRRLARLDAANVAGMLAAATERGGAALAARLHDAHSAAAALAARRARVAEPARGAPDAVHARSGAARADENARALLAELARLFEWLEPPPLRDLDAVAEPPLESADGRARALAAGRALVAALRAEPAAPAHLRRLAAVRERVRRLGRARDALAAAIARYVNNLLIHHGNEAAAAGGAADAERQRADLLPLAPLVRCLRDMDERAYEALGGVYAAQRARALEREVRAACDAARAALAPPAPPERADELLDGVLALVESLCNAEQDFCGRFFSLDAEASGDGESSAGEGRGARGDSLRLRAALFPALEPALEALTRHIERYDEYGAFRVVACVGRRVVGDGASEARWARAALAGCAVAAKRRADRAVAERAAALGECVRAAQRRPKCGVLGFIAEFESWASACERIFAGGRRAELERWCGSLAGAMIACVRHAEHPRTPRAVLQLENYHALGAALAARRSPALEAARRECRTRYEEALRAYVAQYFGRPLERLTAFFEGVAEAVAAGCPEAEVRYRAAFSKHELRRVLALYPAAEVRRALHRLYRTVEKQLSADGALLQVVWRAMQEEFLAQHRALEARLQACYPAAGLALPLSTQDILDAFSDIARDH